MQAQSKQRKLPPNSKTRSGCKQCKEKRLKCDETTPSCLNCVRRDVECPGYQQTYKWILKGQTDPINFSAKTQKRNRPRRRNTDAGNRPQSADNEGSHGMSSSNISTMSQEHLEDQCALAKEGMMIGDVAGGNANMNTLLTDSFDVDPTNEDGLMDELYPVPEPELALVDWNSMMQDFLVQPSEVSRAIPFRNPGSPQTISENIMTGPCLDWFALDRPALSHSTSPRKANVRDLLRGYYGTRPSIPPPLVQQTTKLVDYYFSTISKVYSCFDSDLNPFRSFVGQMWSYSAAMYYAMQSMAAAHLANDLPSMRKAGADLHLQASQQLSQELYKCYSTNPSDSQPLLVLLLLGLSACWQRPGDLGLPYLRTARSLMHSHPAFNRPNGADAAGPVHQVFEEAMVYWELLTSFVADENDIDVVHVEDPDQLSTIADVSSMTSEGESITTPEASPHPWTGICPETQIQLARVGRLVRRVRIQNKKNGISTQTQDLYLALALEETLLSTFFPMTNVNIESGDHFTKGSDFIALAQATRNCGLLELYRTFPTLLQRRLASNPDGFLGITEQSDVVFPSSDLLRQRSWLTSFAIHILQILETIPPTSTVRANQLLMILIAAAELRLLPRNPEQELYGFCDFDLEISRARGFARSRLHQLSVQLPAQPIKVMSGLLDEVWLRLDATGADDIDDIFWMDVMVEKGWHTIMG